MRFVFAGAGAVGGTIGGQLAKAGYEVAFVERDEEHAAAIRDHGLQLRGVYGDHTLRVPIVTHARDVDFRESDVVFLAVKAYDTEAAVAELRAATDLELPVFCAQNGVRNEEIAARAFRDVHGVVLVLNVKRLEPGIVVHTLDNTVYVGSYPSGLGRRGAQVVEALQTTDLAVSATDDIVRQKWNKLLMNLNNATFGLTGMSTQVGKGDREMRLWMVEVFEEGMNVLRAAGIEFEGGEGMGAFEERLRQIRDVDGYTPPLPERPELVGYPSLWQDIYHRRGRVEAEYFNGEIARLGREHGVPTPYNSLLLELSTEQAEARRPPGTHPIPALREALHAHAGA